MILKAQVQSVGDKTVISGLRWYASDRYGLLITVGGDFSQTVVKNGTLSRLVGGIELHCGYLRPLIYTTASKYAGCLWYCCTFDENLTKTWRTA